MYNKDYFNGKKSNYRFGYESLKSEFVWKYRIKIVRKYKKKGKILDIGCALGYFLNSKYSNLKFMGYVKHISYVHSGGDIFFFPSFWETQGMAILEAAAQGKPIILRDLPVYDWAKNGRNCLKANCPLEFADCIKKLAENPELRKKLGSEAKKFAEKKTKCKML